MHAVQSTDARTEATAVEARILSRNEWPFQHHLSVSKNPKTTTSRHVTHVLQPRCKVCPTHRPCLCLLQCCEGGLASAHLLPLGQLPAHDALQDVAPYGHVEDVARQRASPQRLSPPVPQRHLHSRRPCTRPPFTMNKKGNAMLSHLPATRGSHKRLLEQLGVQNRGGTPSLQTCAQS